MSDVERNWNASDDALHKALSDVSGLHVAKYDVWRIREILAAEGYVLVPVKPTQHMREVSVGALAEAFKPEADRIRNLPKEEMPPAWIPISIVGSMHTDPVWAAMVEASRKGG